MKRDAPFGVRWHFWSTPAERSGDGALAALEDLGRTQAHSEIQLKRRRRFALPAHSKGGALQVSAMTASPLQVRDEFDRIALLTERHGRLNDIYAIQLLQNLPSHVGTALEIGCGTGEFTRLLATGAKSVVAIDLSPQMIRLARLQSAAYQNIEYLLDDFMSRPLPSEEFDCVVSLATLHHLSLDVAIPKMKGALKPNGVLIIHDLLSADGLADRSLSALAYPVSAARRFLKTGRLRAPREVREAWNEHGRGEVYLTLGGVRAMCDRYLPEARIQRHLMWRYTVVWRKCGSG